VGLGIGKRQGASPRATENNPPLDSEVLTDL
jgi:hypothetical protein